MLIEEELKEIQNVIKGYLSLLIPDEEVKKLIEEDSLLMNDIKKWGADDTEVRGMIASLFSKLLLNRNWPTYGDNVDIKSFYSDLLQKAKEKGWEIIKD